MKGRGSAIRTPRLNPAPHPVRLGAPGTIPSLCLIPHREKEVTVPAAWIAGRIK